jgi:hypothetical protein
MWPYEDKTHQFNGMLVVKKCKLMNIPSLYHLDDVSK